MPISASCARRTSPSPSRTASCSGLSLDSTQGFGVRVIADGAWGFASSHLLEPAEVDRVTALAVQIAKASALAKIEDVDIGPPEVHVGILPHAGGD